MDNNNFIKASSKDAMLKATQIYHYEPILYKFLENYEVSYADAKFLFEETKKWLYFSVQRKKRGLVSTIFPEVVALDEMWHCFILFSREYTKFCRHAFGRYIHHSPTTKAEKDKRAQELKENREATLNQGLAERRKQYQAVMEIMGPQTLYTWFVEIPKRFGLDFKYKAFKRNPWKVPQAYQQKLGELSQQFSKLQPNLEQVA